MLRLCLQTTSQRHLIHSYANGDFVLLFCSQQVTAREVQASLIPILQAFHERCIYLNALLGDATPSLNVLKAGLKVGFEDKKAQSKDSKSAKPDLK